MGWDPWPMFDLFWTDLIQSDLKRILYLLSIGNRLIENIKNL